MKTLDEIALDFGTDKSSLHHNYTKAYAFYFDRLRFEKLNILEIGLGGGGSVKTWKEYFANAKIVGVDILDERYLEEERIHILQGDQSDFNFLAKVNSLHGPFDIIIDDGSHLNKDMKNSFEFLFPLLKPGGLYITEDLHACYTDTDAPVFIDLIKRLVDHVNSSGKSICANIQYDEESKEFYIRPQENGYERKNIASMNWWEKSVEFVHLYRSIVFIKKYSLNIEKMSTDHLGETYLEKFSKSKIIKFIKRHIPLAIKNSVKKIIRKLK